MKDFVSEPGLGDWVEIDDLPWSDSYVYALIRRYPNELKTVLLGASGVGGKRLISKSSLLALIGRLCEEQACDKGAKAKRSAFYRNKRAKKELEEAPA